MLDIRPCEELFPPAMRIWLTLELDNLLRTGPTQC